MKISKGILSDADDVRPQTVAARGASNDAPVVDVEKNRLFETLNAETPSERNYLKLLGLVAVVVVIGGLIVSYLMIPGVGDEVRVSREVELAIRNHFLEREKRTATDITFYQCDGFFGARVGVETRTDMPNPIYRIATYSARATATGDAWNVTAQPITSPEMDKPCL
ncbi:MAG: hypothetical protein ACKVQW_04370 [Pyrinomonadaceae bacterium]